MKFPSHPSILFLVAACTGLASAQDCVATALSVIPSCAQNCILNGATTVGCGGTDFSCQCQKTAALFAAVDNCVSAACPSASYQAVIDGASTVCDCASPAVLAGTASATASGISGISAISGTVPASVPASNTATVTGSASTTLSTATTATSGSSSGSVSTSAPTATTSIDNGSTFTGYTSVIPVATASVIGAAGQQARPGGSGMELVVAAVMVVAAVL